MRHNLPVLVESPRTGARTRAPRLIGLFAALVAACSFIWGMAPAALGATSFPSALGEVSPAAAPPTVEPVEDRTGTVGKPIVPIPIKGTELFKVGVAPELPKGLTLAPVAGHEETEWRISG